ncbi:bifunctional hydroxymethylpyrimidine kinase/phosphomethylpyrimidine kinase [Aporhodopirellula aestuarii]|uniref:hydroxymethylpyrimidine kinase n=1 Tax=Aporhodopirellula aestuarii TaxID=2950107 RepID=A0ABT0U900_9BACT|nr:bifunctional hydroxymethylpyrimidine kinase/phosphomethylpyrimidine kinase [Aporhodopirellula aestuarii]MCM2373444.1 bifunctional hydroxymethylpyrimidine kinase/phosphomethylpyrimidine kinase [Aporhodopirellula aestuarii]
MDRKVSIAPHAIALTIAGSDPSGGAGLQADLKAFQQNGVYGMSVVTLITVQNTLGVGRVEMLSADLVCEQYDAVMSDIPPRVIKTGALGTGAIIAEVAARLKTCGCPIVVDPVMVSKHGAPLVDDAAVMAYREVMLPLSTLITPNRFEAERLLDRKIGSDLDDLLEATQQLQELGPEMVLLKAGEFDGSQLHLFYSGETIVTLTLERHRTDCTQGAGCSLAATIAARIALSSPEEDLAKRTRAAVDFGIAAVNHAIRFAPKYGNGCGPIESRLLHIGD